MANVIVASGQPVELAALAEIVRGSGHKVIAEVTSGQKALRLVRDERPDMLVLATDIPLVDGIEVLRRLKSSGVTTRVLLYGEAGAKHIVQHSFDAGADGFVGRDESAEELRRAIGGVLSGHRYFPYFEKVEWLARKRLDPANPVSALSQRELTILRYLARGVPNIQIAQELSLSPKTVSAHRNRLSLLILHGDTASLATYPPPKSVAPRLSPPVTVKQISCGKCSTAHRCRFTYGIAVADLLRAMPLSLSSTKRRSRPWKEHSFAI
jgi:DNA-binding NarL/FixJ family response regulator